MVCALRRDCGAPRHKPLIAFHSVVVFGRLSWGKILKYENGASKAHEK